MPSEAIFDALWLSKAIFDALQPSKAIVNGLLPSDAIDAALRPTKAITEGSGPSKADESHIVSASNLVVLASGRHADCAIWQMNNEDECHCRRITQ